MSGTATWPTLYEKRVQLVLDVLRKNSDLGEKAATELAKHVLHAIDHIPEKVR